MSNSQEISPDQIIMQMLFGKFISRALTVAAELAIADHLKDGAKRVAELGSKSGTNEDGLYRLLRALSSVGVFKEKALRVFARIMRCHSCSKAMFQVP